MCVEKCPDFTIIPPLKVESGNLSKVICLEGVKKPTVSMVIDAPNFKNFTAHCHRVLGISALARNFHVIARCEVQVNLITVGLNYLYFSSPLLSEILSCLPADLKTRKSTGTSCQIEIYFLRQTSKFLIKYNLLRF